MFNLPNDKMYIGIVVIIGLIILVFGTSAYVKSCVKNEFDEIKEISKKKRKILMKRQIEEVERHRQREMQEQIKEEHEQEEDMESYVDPTRQEQYQQQYPQQHQHQQPQNNDIEGFNSGDFDVQAINQNPDKNGNMNKENVLMRDLFDGSR